MTGPPTTIEEMEALSAELKRESNRLAAEAAGWDAVIAARKVFSTSEPHYGTKERMQAAAAVSKNAGPAPRARGRDITSESPIGAAATALGVTLKDLSKRLGYSYDTVRKWSSKGAVPVDVQERIDALLKTKRGGR